MDPALLAWSDQFGALVRDKCEQMLDAIEITGWDILGHRFTDPSNGDDYHLYFEDGEFYLRCLVDNDAPIVVLDLERLGVAL